MSDREQELTDGLIDMVIQFACQGSRNGIYADIETELALRGDDWRPADFADLTQRLMRELELARTAAMTPLRRMHLLGIAALAVSGVAAIDWQAAEEQS